MKNTVHTHSPTEQRLHSQGSYHGSETLDSWGQDLRIPPRHVLTMKLQRNTMFDLQADGSSQPAVMSEIVMWQKRFKHSS